MLLKLEYREKKKEEEKKKNRLLKYENKASGPERREYYTLLFRCRVHVLVTSSLTLEHPVRERWMRARDGEEDERKYERGRGELSQ